MFRRNRLEVPIYYRITVTFLGLMIMLFLIIAITGYITGRYMENYIREVMTQNYEAALEDFDQVLTGLDWTVDSLEFQNYLEEYGKRRGLHFEMTDLDGNLIFSNLQHRGKPLDEERHQPPRGPFGMRPSMSIETMTLKVDEIPVATMEVRYFDAGFMNPLEVEFFEAMGGVFRWSVMTTLIICLIVSFFFARSITVPLKKVETAALDISDGILETRVTTSSGISEIESLGKSVNHLAANLEKQDALRKQVTSDMAHEIRTPLTSLRNFFEAFIDGIFEPNEENMTKCHDEIVRMSDLVDRLKDIATIEEMNITSNEEKLILNEEVSAIYDLLKPEFDKKDIELNFIQHAKPSVIIDRNHLRQIISNLLTNANRYTDPGGHVTLEVDEEGDEVFLRVADDGIGMSEEDADLIFERFYRVDKSRNRATGGMGVGLTIVKKLIESYGGTIEVESRLDVGSTFTVRMLKIPL